MNIEQFIEFVIDLANDHFYERFDGDTRFFFLNGGCYEFAKIINRYIPKSRIAINQNSDHCVIEYNGKMYDSTGLIDNRYKSEYHVANSEDITYMEERFGIPEKQYINKIKISDFLINEIKKCNILDKLKLDNEELER